MIRRVFFKWMFLGALVFNALESGAVRCQTIFTDVNRLVEIELHSSIRYTHPHQDVDIGCRLDGPDGRMFSVNGFWYGGDRFLVRFSLPQTGKWIYQITCSDPGNSGLHGRQGTIDVYPYTGINPLYAHGFLKTSQNGHYLIHEDGHPFFYLGDTAWEITWKSDSTEFLQYLDDRKKKGFSAIQIVAMTHQNHRLKAYGVQNRYGEPFFLNEDFSMFNPRYFDYLDFIVRKANDSGLLVSLVPLWASMTELYSSQYPFVLSTKQSLLLGKYVGERYSGFHVVWVIGGDNAYDTIQRKIFWTLFATVIKKTTGSRQLMTLHPKGWKSSFDYFDNNTKWLDFHMYQSSHKAGADFTWFAGSEGYGLKPPKPVLNGEACYEDICDNLWQPQDTSQVNMPRIRPEHVRQASYESILSGAQVGITYGANGVWQWHTQELPGTHLPRVPAKEAWQFPGSTQMGVLKKVMVRFKWYQLRPAQHLLWEFKSDENYLPIAGSDSLLMAYCPQHTQWVSIKPNFFSGKISYFWIDPTSGDSTSATETASLIRLRPPDASDWILIATVRREPARFILYHNYPNPFNRSTRIDYDLRQESDVESGIYNVEGQKVLSLFRAHQSAGKHQLRWEGQNDQGGIVASGVYFLHVRAAGSEQTRKILFVK